MSPASPSDRGYEDKKHHSHFGSSQVYNKKRRHADYSDVEDQEYATRKEKVSTCQGGDAGKDALADFRAKIAEEEARRYRHHDPRRTDSTSSKDVYHRWYDAHVSDRRRDYESKRSHHHQPRDQRYSYPDEVSERQTSRHSASKGHQDREGTTLGGRSRSADRDITSRQRYRLSSTGKHTEERQAPPVNNSKKNCEDDKRGRSLSRSSLTHRSLSSRCSSSVYSDYHYSYRKRRRSRSRSRSTSRERKKDRKDRKERRSSGKKRDKEKSETRRSVLTGKKLKLKVKKDKDDVERDAKRQELLKFLNSACD